MSKLILKTLAAGLAMAAGSGQAHAAMLPGAKGVSAMANRGNAVSANGELKSRAIFGQREAGVPQAVVGAANDGSVQARAIQTDQDEVPQAAKFNVAADVTRAPRVTVLVPEPGGWSTALACLLGVIAIARRRMSP